MHREKPDCKPGALYLGVAEIADLEQRPAATATVIGQQQVLKLQVPIGNALQSAPRLLIGQRVVVIADSLIPIAS